MFLKKKRSGIIKGRGCADGRKQRLYLNKDDVSAPTVATEALLITCLVDALEGRDVATVDIPGAFMQADIERDDIHMKLEGIMVDILTKIYPKLYAKYTAIENGREMMNVKLKKALYGTLQAALIFWKNLPVPL
uniref:Reverse transcriptase Ty1/copia-type domain-containing protein n=1 Tax=Eucampia antarctica TaxID=49252 RepID=A0A7S2W0X4_9STRA|mmetsp:Transcript_16588/g.16010  ORF Transcript_16588/g.16010 Transcript_16588/m.16010 type:complete len:134 (+) Transcript_16588:691-1092(+)